MSFIAGEGFKFCKETTVYLFFFTQTAMSSLKREKMYIGLNACKSTIYCSIEAITSSVFFFLKNETREPQSNVFQINAVHFIPNQRISKT